jgi:hypothetical protein
LRDRVSEQARAQRVLSRPAVVKCHQVEGVAYGLLIFVATFVPFELFIFGVAAIRRDWPGRWFVAGLALAATEAAVVWIAIALLRRRRWARPAAIAVFTLALLLFVAMAIEPFVRSSEDAEGEIYALMGAAMMAGLCLLGLIATLRHAADHCFGPPPAGWLPDPSTRAPAWRYWDGERWGEAEPR